MPDLPDIYEYLKEAKLVFQRSDYNAASALCRSALETALKHLVVNIDPTINVNSYHDIPGIKALNKILYDSNYYSNIISKEINDLTKYIGNMAVHGSTIISEQDAFYFLERLNTLIKTILNPKEKSLTKLSWWNDPTFLNEYMQKWGNHLSKAVNENTIDNLVSKYIDLQLVEYKKAEPTKKEPALTELRKYPVPLIPMYPFFSSQYHKSVVTQLLDQQGIDKFERPYAEWKIAWQPGYDLFGGLVDSFKEKRSPFFENPAISLLSLFEDPAKLQSWVIGNPGSGKSYMARKIWYYFIDALINNEEQYIPLFIDFNDKNTLSLVNDIINKKFIDNFSKTRLVRLITQHTTYLELPSEDDFEDCPILIIIDSIDEMISLDPFYKLMELISVKNIPFIAFSREYFLKELEKLILSTHTIYQILPPDDSFVRSFLNQEQIKKYSELSLEFRAQLSLPLFLKLFADNFTELIKLREVNSKGDFLLKITKLLLVRGIEKLLGRVAIQSADDDINTIILKIASRVGKNSNFKINNLLDLTDEHISILNSDMHLSTLLEKAGLVFENSFRHKLFQEFFYAFFVLKYDSEENLDITPTIFQLCYDLYFSHEFITDQTVLNRIKVIYKKSIDIDPFLVAEYYFPEFLEKNDEKMLIGKVIDVLEYRRIVEHPFSQINLFNFSNEHPMLPLHLAIRVLSNNHFLNVISKEDAFGFCYENLIQSLKFTSPIKINLSGLKSFDLIIQLFEANNVPKNTMLKILASTKDIRAINIITRFLEDDSSISYHKSIKEALLEIGVIGESLLIDEIQKSANKNKKFILYDVIGEFRSDKIYRFLLQEYAREENVFLKSKIIKGLLLYSNHETNERLCEEVFTSSGFTQTILLSGFSFYPCKEFIDGLTEERIVNFYQMNNFLFTRILIINVQFIKKSFIEPLIKEYSDINHVNIFILDLFVEYGKLSDKNQRFVVEKLMEWGRDHKPDLMTHLGQLSGYYANKATLEIIESEQLYKENSNLFLFLEQKKDISSVIFESLKTTINKDFAYELIRLLGLLGYSSNMEDFLNVSIIYTNDLREIATWAIIRMALRRPEKLADHLMANDTELNTLVLEACMSINSQKTRYVLITTLDHISDKNLKTRVLIALLVMREKSVTSKALSMLDENINYNLKTNLIFSLRFTNDKNVVDRLEQHLNDPRDILFKSALFTLTEMKSKKSAKYWVSALRKGTLKLDMKTSAWLTKYLPVNEFIEIFIEFFEEIKINYITNRLPVLNKDINMSLLLEKFPELSQIPFIEENDSLIADLGSYLIRTGSIKEGPINEQIRSNDLIRITPYQDFDRYFFAFQEEFILQLTSLSEIVANITKSNGSEFFNYIKSLDSNQALLLVILSCNYINTRDAEKFLHEIIKETSIKTIIRRTAYDGLLKYYARNISRLKEIKADDNVLMSIIFYMDPSNQESQTYCKEIVHKTTNPQLKYYASRKTLDSRIIRETIGEVLEKLEREYDINEAINIIGEMGLGDLLSVVMRIFETTRSQSTKQQCLETFKKICSPIITVQLLDNLKPKNQFFMNDNYDITSVLEKHLNKFMLDKLLQNKEPFMEKLEKRDIMRLLLNGKDPSYWEPIVELINSMDISEEWSSLIGLNSFMPFVDPELLEPSYQSSQNSDVRNFLLDLLIQSGRRKYLEWWFKELERTTSNQNINFKISGNFQLELFKDFLLKCNNAEIKKLVLEKTFFTKDISFLSELMDYIENESNIQLKNLLVNKIEGMI